MRSSNLAGCTVKLPLFELIWANVFLRFGKLNFLANCPIDLKKLFNNLFSIRLLFFKPPGLKRYFPIHIFVTQKGI